MSKARRKLTGRLAFVLDRLEARVLRSGPPPEEDFRGSSAHFAPLRPGGMAFTSFLQAASSCEDPVELPQEEAAEDGPSVPFRLHEAKICNVATGENPYFGHLSFKAKAKCSGERCCKVTKMSQQTVACSTEGCRPRFSPKRSNLFGKGEAFDARCRLRRQAQHWATDC